MKVTNIIALIVLISCLNPLLMGLKNEVRFTERPFIDIFQAPDDAMEDGWIRIKFVNSLTDHLDNFPMIQDDGGIIVSSIPEIDKLNRQYGIHKAIKLFESPALKNGYEWRHRMWGLHLWYEFHYDSDADIRDIVMAYRDLINIIEWAEPEYKKSLTIDPGFDDYVYSREELLDYYRENNPRWIPNDPQFIDQWHYHNTGQHNGTPGADIRLVDAWDIETGNADIIVAIVDGGIQFNHPDLELNMWDGIGYNFVNNSPNVIAHNHGTHVAGTVAAVTNNNVGVSGIAGGSGLGDGVRLMSCQVFTSSSSGGFHLAMIYGADNGAAINQNSWGYTTVGYYDQAVMDAIDYFNANGGGDVMDGGITIFSAGNNNTTGAWYPKCAPSCFSVAATNNQDIKAWYSTYDTWVNISAPGGETNTVSARGVLSTRINNGYGFAQGTSMAAPHVSGVAALLLSYAYRNEYIMTNDELAAILEDTTDDHYHLNPGFIGMLGTGRLNALAALLTLDALLPGVEDPINLVATTVDLNQIEITWDLNEDDDSVMLIWSPDDEFGIPQEGYGYFIGQTIPGGGTVIYKGNGTSFTHLGLQEATPNYYLAVSFDSDYLYSEGVRTFALTDYTYKTLPLIENFNSSDTSPFFWLIIDRLDTGQVWQVGTIDEGLEGTTGNYAYIESNVHGPSGNQNSDLVTPRINLTGYRDVTVSFAHYFKQNGVNSLAIFSYSLNDEDTWHYVTSWNSDTNNPSYYSALIPSLTGEQNVRFRWSYLGSNGHFWCIDDIVIIAQEVELLSPHDFGILTGYRSVRLSWSAQEESFPIGYNIYRDGELLNSEPVMEFELIDSDLTIGQTYQYYVTALYEEGESEPSEILEVTLELLPPTNLTYEVFDENIVRLMWEAPEYDFTRILEPIRNSRTFRDQRSDNRGTHNYGRYILGYNIYRNLWPVNETMIEDTEYLDDSGLLSGDYFYYVTAVYAEGESEYSNEVLVLIYTSTDDSDIPSLTTELRNNYPNPFNPETRIDFSLKENGFVSIDIFNIRGQRIATLVNEFLEAGNHSIKWNGRTEQGSEATSGIFFYRMVSGDYAETKRMILLK